MVQQGKNKPVKEIHVVIQVRHQTCANIKKFNLHSIPSLSSFPFKKKKNLNTSSEYPVPKESIYRDS